MTGGLILASLACIGLAGALDLAVGANHGWLRPLPYLLGLVGSGCAAAAGALAVMGPATRINLGSLLGVGQTSLHLDGLAGLFLVLTSTLGMAISAAMASWARPEGRLQGRGTATGYALLLGAVVVIITAGDAFLFLFGWETLTVAFYMLTSVTRRSGTQASASWATLGFGKVSGAALLFGFLLLAGRSGSFTISTWHVIGPGALHAAAYGLIVAGFAAKVGVLPFQVWLPAGYPVAPGPARAAMAGLAANVGFYGLWRFLAVLGRPPTWLVVAVLLLGGVTALVGIAFAAVQSDLNRLIAYSSVENAGIIFTAYGVALAGAAVGRSELVAVGLLAATLQVVAHAVAKSGLFVTSANMQAATGSAQLEDMRGVGRTMPWSGATFALGSLTLAGLPPTIGFVSEWFVLEALMQQFRLQGLAVRLAMAAAGALMALTAGVVALTFVRLLGLPVLGPHNSKPWKQTSEGVMGRAGILLLGVSCLGIAAVSPWEIRFLARGLGPVVPASLTERALHSAWVLQPVFANFSILSPSWLVIVLPLLMVAVVVAGSALSWGRLLRVRRVPAWRSATGGVAGPDHYSAFGYANPLRHVLGNVLGTRKQLDVASPGATEAGHAHIEYQARVTEPVETYLYRPLRRSMVGLARLAKRLQSGQLAAYIAYMLIALVALLAVAAALA